MPLINCVNLTLGYEGRAVVSNLNFSVKQGDFLCILGENGAGKSTLMKTLLNLQKPLGGQIIFGDGLKQNEIGYLPQQNVVQKDFPASVFEVVISGCINKMGLKPFYGKKEKEIANDAINKMGLTSLAKKSYRELSGGQQQRVLLARALCATSKILLLDEPVSGLDPMITQDMYSLIEQLNKELGITIIMISHDINAAIKYANNILHICSVPFFGSKEEYLNSNIGKKFVGGDK